MIFLAVAVVPIFLLLVLSEILWRAKLLRGEAARKLLHIIIGSYVATWPFFISFAEIEKLSVALFVVVTLSHYLHIFHAIIDVKRRSLGDLLYAIGIGVTAILVRNPWIFAVAILHLSISDGLAGLVGNKYGKGNTYKVLGKTKSLVGSGVFALSSLLILLAIVPAHLHITLGPLLILLPLTAVLVENIGVFGTDNVLVPLLFVLALNTLV